MSNLFKPIKVGKIELAHRIALPPLTRFRSPNHVPTDLVAEYYEQRASEPGTLLITEATFITAAAGGYPGAPGLWSDEQAAAWKKVVDKVHGKKSFLYAQLWALGRTGVPAVLQAEGPYDLVSSSNVPLTTSPDAIPRPLTVAEIDQYVIDYATAAKNFVEKSGGDGVEIHSANGYLLDQFLQTTANKRTDEYGGSVENRARFTLRVLESVTKAVGQERVGIRISPFGVFQDMGMDDKNTLETFSYLVKEIKSRFPNLAYIHAIEKGAWNAPKPNGEENYLEAPVSTLEPYEKIWYPKPFIVSGGYTAELAKERATRSDNVIIGIGRYFISNPDLVKRIRENIPFTKYDRPTFYSSEAKGYTDYPFAS